MINSLDNPIQTIMTDGQSFTSVMGGDINISTISQEVPQIQTVIQDNISTVSTVVNAPWVQVTSINGMTGDVTVEPIIQPFQPNHYYQENTVIVHSGGLYYAKTSFTSGATFNSVNWTAIVSGEGGGGATQWGEIFGNLSSQTDLTQALAAKQDLITPGTTSQYYRGDKSWRVLNSTAVGLGNVNNTSDLDKPVSNATNLALGTKANIIHTHIISDITGLQTELDDKLEYSALLDIESDISDLQNALSGKESSFSKGSLVAGTNISLSGNLTNRLVGSGNITINSTGGDIPVITQQQSDWGETDDNKVTYILNKPTIPSKLTDLTNDGHFVRDENYADHIDKLDTIEEGAQVNSIISVAGKTGVITIGVTDLTATGRTTSNFLRGDNTWATPTNTTYSEITEAEIINTTSSTIRLISGRRAEYLMAKEATTTRVLTNKTLSSPVINLPTGITKSDVGLGNVDNTSDATKNSAVATLTNKTVSTGSTIDANVNVVEVLKKVYPVGSIYMSVNNTNPATIFGFGTWTSWGTGKTAIGVDTTQTEFNTVEKTGGSKTHTLTVDEMPSHTHTQNSHNHLQNPHGHRVRYDTTGGTAMHGPNSTGDKFKDLNTWIENTTATNIATTATNQNTGGGQAHNNLPPYITAYFWKRTA